MTRRPPRSTRTDTLFPLHDALPIYQRLQDYGVETRQIPAGAYPRSGRRIEFTLPTGHICQLYAFKEQVGNGMESANPGTIPDDGYIKGMRIIRLDHCLLGGRDIAASRDLFINVFGFNRTEELQDHENRAPRSEEHTTELQSRMP